MTKDEIGQLIEDAIEVIPSGTFSNPNDAARVAASALNYLMDQVDDGPSDKDSD